VPVPDLPDIEGFRVLEELGSGALSTVYKAVDMPIGRAVALKVLKATLATSSPFASQLEREAKILAELCHPNVGMLLGFVKTDSRMLLVLEYIDGFSLSTLLMKKPAMGPDSVAAIGVAVARGLAHAHQRGIVHRDIKPANVLIGRRGEVKILDFGIAQRSAAGDVPVGVAPMRMEDVAAYGTPAYMSPEQILGENVDARSDVFSLGVVLYQLVCGARPFERSDETDRRPAAHRIRRDPPIPLHRRAPDVPPALERIVMRAIEKLPADRFQTTEDLAEQLEELLGSRTGQRVEELVVQTLQEAGLVRAPEATGAAVPRESKRASVRRAVAGLAFLGGVSVAGGIALQATAHREGHTAGAQPLELVPAAPGYLRVLATPWAEVWVDGQRVDVTPFARGIPLPIGTHYITLVHPNAPVEKRTIDIVSAETRTIDVVMTIPDLSPRGEAGSNEPSADRGAR
jgi:hypothetical protein